MSLSLNHLPYPKAQKKIKLFLELPFRLPHGNPKNNIQAGLSRMCFYCNMCITVAKEIGDEEPYYSTKISIFSFIWAGLAIDLVDNN